MVKLDAIRQVLSLVARGQPVPDRLLQQAAVEVVNIIDAPQPNPRRVVSFHRAREVQRLRDEGYPCRTICERLGLTKHQYYRALENSRVIGELSVGPSARSTR